MCGVFILHNFNIWNEENVKEIFVLDLKFTNYLVEDLRLQAKRHRFPLFLAENN